LHLPDVVLDLSEFYNVYGKKIYGLGKRLTDADNFQRHGITMKHKLTLLWLLYVMAFLSLFCLCGCSATIKEIQTEKGFTVDPLKTEMPFASPEVIKLHETNLRQKYFMGPGDEIRIDVWNREKLSQDHVVGPFGYITLPMHGEFKIGGMDRFKAAQAISKIYMKYYDDPITTVKIFKYMNNKVYVLGRVSNPGVIHFSGNATILEALSLAGGLPTRDKTIFLSKCYIIRGKNQIIWIDLLQLLEKANINLNIRLANNDIIYIPESMDQAVFVMGEVKNPGSYQIQTSSLSLMDALNMAGGPTEDADIQQVRLIVAMKDQKGVKIVDLDKILSQGNFAENYLLKDNDILYVPRRGIAKFNYYLRQIDPFLRTFISGTVIQEAMKD
jgi:polysaccharide biosynthesis/export protein